MRITDFEISNFRTFERLQLGGLKRVNLIAGENNTGKTALLEALWHFSGPDSPNIGLRLDRFRGIETIDPDELLFDLFHDYDASKPIDLRARGDWGNHRRILRIETRPREASRIPIQSDALVNHLGGSPHEMVLRFTEGATESEARGWLVVRNSGSGESQGEFEQRQQQIAGGPVSHYYPARHRNPPREEADRLGRMELQGMEGLIRDALKPFEPRLRRLTTVSVNGAPVIHADVGQRRLIPMGLLGDGMQRVLSLTLAFTGASGGMVLVDEIENGIHHSKLMDLWRAILLFSRRFDVQVFATTHSQECVRAAHFTFSEAGDYDFCLFRLDRINGKIAPKTLGRNTLEAAIDANWEVR